MRESEGGEYNGEVGWERVDRDFRLRNRNRCGCGSCLTKTETDGGDESIEFFLLATIVGDNDW